MVTSVVRHAVAIAGAMLLALPAIAAAAAPDTTITSGPSGPVASTTATFTFTSTIAGSGFKCKIDAKVWRPCASPKTYLNLKQGNHTFEVKAKKGTKVDRTPAVRSFKVDTFSPNTTITDGPIGNTLDLAPEWYFRSSEQDVTFECTFDAYPWSGNWNDCTSPWEVGNLSYRQQYSMLVRARDAAGNVDATPASRTFTVVPINPDGDPWGQAAARLYFPASVDIDVPATCGSGGTDCPGGTAAAPANQLRMQTTNLSAVYVNGSSRWDVTATVGVSQLSGITINLPLVGDCALTVDSSRGSVATWELRLQLNFAYTPYTPYGGDVLITAANESLSNVEASDWALSGNVVCAASGDVSGTVRKAMLDAFHHFWESVGIPLCEAPAPDLVGACPVQTSRAGPPARGG